MSGGPISGVDGVQSNNIRWFQNEADKAKVVSPKVIRIEVLPLGISVSEE